VMRVRATVVVAALLMTLAAAGPAIADTYCVHTGQFRCDGTEEGADLQAALNDAEAHPGEDNVIVGPGAYSGPFIYTGTSDPVHLIGAGAPVLTAPTVGTPTVLKLNGGGSLSTVDAINVRVPAVAQATGLFLDGAATHISVSETSDASPAVGVWMDGNSKLEASAVHVGSASIALVNTGANATVADSSLVGRDGIQLDSGSVDASNLEVSASDVGILVAVTDPADLHLRDSLVHVTSASGVGIRGLTFGSVAGEAVTIAGSGSGLGAVVQPFGAGNVAFLSLTSSIVSGFATDVECDDAGGGEAALTVRRSDFASKNVALCNTFTDLGGNLGVDPQFVDPASSPLSPRTDFHLRWSSPLIDAGEQVGGIATDLDGLPRTVDGNGNGVQAPDMGVYEYQRRPPVPVVSASPAQVGPGVSVSFSAVGSHDPDPGDALTFAWTFDDGSSASGISVSHTFKAAGKHTGTLNVTDPTGLTTVATASVTVVPAPPVSPVDRISPVVAGLRLTPARFRVAPPGAPATVHGRNGTTINFRLSETAGVRLEVQHLVIGRRSRGRCLAMTPRPRRAGRCRRYVPAGTLMRAGVAGGNRFRFSGRIAGRPLASGSYRLVLTATDASGNRSTPSRAAFGVLAGGCTLERTKPGGSPSNGVQRAECHVSHTGRKHPGPL
jgi:hypothetical protein